MTGKFEAMREAGALAALHLCSIPRPIGMNPCLSTTP
jgi:hypothetical protein